MIINLVIFVTRTVSILIFCRRDDNMKHWCSAVFYLNTPRISEISRFPIVQNMTETSNNQNCYAIDFSGIA